MEKLYPWRIGAITEILRNCLAYATNIDRALKTCFKTSPKLGKKDRVFITEHCYAILRNLYQHGSDDLQKAIVGYFDSLEYDTSRIDFREVNFDLDPPAFEMKFSMPLWFVEELNASYGLSEVKNVLSTLNQRKMAFVRVNTNEISVEAFVSLLKRADIQCVPQNESATCLLIDQDSIVALSQSEWYNRGYFEYQDFASQSLLEYVSPHLSGVDSILDLCAGEGGKSVQLAQYFNAGKRFAYDIIPDKTKHLKRRFERLKNSYSPEIVTAAELKQLTNLNLILIDAPCSGTGTFGRLPTQKYHLSKQHYSEMQNIQRQLLSESAGKVASGGFIAYSTCSVLKKENHDQVQAFLEKNSEFSLLTEKLFMPTNDHDGLYVALLQKT